MNYTNEDNNDQMQNNNIQSLRPLNYNSNIGKISKRKQKFNTVNNNQEVIEFKSQEDLIFMKNPLPIQNMEPYQVKTRRKKQKQLCDSSNNIINNNNKKKNEYQIIQPNKSNSSVKINTKIKSKKYYTTKNSNKSYNSYTNDNFSNDINNHEITNANNNISLNNFNTTYQGQNSVKVKGNKMINHYSNNKNNHLTMTKSSMQITGNYPLNYSQNINYNQSKIESMEFNIEGNNNSRGKFSRKNNIENFNVNKARSIQNKYINNQNYKNKTHLVKRETNNKIMNYDSNDNFNLTPVLVPDDTIYYSNNINENSDIKNDKIYNKYNTNNSIVNNNAKVKLKEYLKKNKAKKYPKNNVIKPKNLSFQSKKIIKMESLSKKGFWQPGRDKANQDNYFILKNVNDNEKYLYMGVCDGHGAYGEEISKFLINNLPQNLNNNIINSKIKYLSFEPINNLSKIIVNSFIQTDKELINNQNINTYLSGSTCVSILFTPRRLISINIGDSRCTLGKFNGEKWLSKDLSRDHKPSEEDEKRRIILSGGRVEKNKDEFGNERGPLRIWAKDEDSPGLAVSRSFGDELAHKIGVITEPEIYEYVFLSEDKFFILGSDGLWEYISSEECVNIVKDYYIKNDIEGAINYLYKESSKRWIMEEDVIDDITLIIVFMN